VRRRRRWPGAEKERIVAAAMEVDAVVIGNRGAAPTIAAVVFSPQALPGGVYGSV